jgi:hypothetical protein
MQEENKTVRQEMEASVEKRKTGKLDVAAHCTHALSAAA